MRPIGTIDAKSSAVMPIRCHATSKHLSRNSTGVNCINPNALLGIVQRRRSCQPHDGMFTATYGDALKRNQPYRGGIDDHPSSLSQHLLDFIFHAQEQSPHVNRHQFVKVVDRLLVQGFWKRLGVALLVKHNRALNFDCGLHALYLGFVRDIRLHK